MSAGMQRHLLSCTTRFSRELPRALFILLIINEFTNIDLGDMAVLFLDNLRNIRETANTTQFFETGTEEVNALGSSELAE